MCPFAAISEPIQALVSEIKVAIISLKHHAINKDAVIGKNEHPAITNITRCRELEPSYKRHGALDPTSPAKYRQCLQHLGRIDEINRAIGRNRNAAPEKRRIRNMR